MGECSCYSGVVSPTYREREWGEERGDGATVSPIYVALYRYTLSSVSVWFRCS